MNERTHLIYFSPTETTHKVVTALAEGLGPQEIVHHNLTRALQGATVHLEEGCAVIGIPVYAGRVPEICLERLTRVRADGQPAILVVVYGNREYDDALAELRDFAARAGFAVVAAGTFVGEHSYSNREHPLAQGRPDAGDLAVARRFGAACARKLAAGLPFKPVSIPGTPPYRERVKLGGIAPETEPQLCTLCGACTAVCPTFVITIAEEAVLTRAEACLMCCACVKNCPTDARVFRHPVISEWRCVLEKTCATRKEPEVFL